MADDAPPAQDQPTFTSADRIRQLNEVDKDVAELIHSAGLAIQALTNAEPDASNPSAAVPDGSLESHKTQFKEATARYFALLSSIDVRLRRQVYALEEADVLAPEPAARAGDTTSAGAGAGTGVGATATATGDGEGDPLDISWLNSRKDTVGMDKEAELWAAASELVQKTDQVEAPSGDSSKPEPDSEKMQVD
ncbi:hypothetical protein N7474_009178 [Penicillium riverlandense]|uniref:uncharacterized protein n=1 Tax=Penicillium riverlandense TaxID=1903569 RepID=UPI002546F93C|nr:uncharacterized protein N7474_009178 [Penicillium riverlandense]KAJ5807909.1 hypothetical protein N7474_009178 [Penicillium riverlandense]